MGTAPSPIASSSSAGSSTLSALTAHKNVGTVQPASAPAPTPIAASSTPGAGPAPLPTATSPARIDAIEVSGPKKFGPAPPPSAPVPQPIHAITVSPQPAAPAPPPIDAITVSTPSAPSIAASSMPTTAMEIRPGDKNWVRRVCGSKILRWIIIMLVVWILEGSVMAIATWVFDLKVFHPKGVTAAVIFSPVLYFLVNKYIVGNIESGTVHVLGEVLDVGGGRREQQGRRTRIC